MRRPCLRFFAVLREVLADRAGAGELFKAALAVGDDQGRGLLDAEFTGHVQVLVGDELLIRDARLAQVGRGHRAVRAGDAREEDRALFFRVRGLRCADRRLGLLLVLDRAGIAYEKIYADENPELTEKYGVRLAPTLVVLDGGEAEKIQNLSNIKKFIETRA